MVADKSAKEKERCEIAKGQSIIFLLSLCLSLFFSFFNFFIFIYFFFAREKPWASHGDTRVEHRGTIHPSK